MSEPSECVGRWTPLVSSACLLAVAVWTVSAVLPETVFAADATSGSTGSPADVRGMDTAAADVGVANTGSTDVGREIITDAGSGDVEGDLADGGPADVASEPDAAAKPDTRSPQQRSEPADAGEKENRDAAKDRQTERTERRRKNTGPPTIDPESVDEPETPRPLVLTASVPHLLLGTIKTGSETYFPNLELTLEIRTAPKLSIAPVAGGMFITNDQGLAGVLTAGVQGRAYITDTFNNGIYGGAELLGTASIGGGPADPTAGVPFIYSGIGPSAVIGMKLNPGGGFIMDAQVGLGVRNILANQMSIWDYETQPALDLTININLGWGFASAREGSASEDR